MMASAVSCWPRWTFSAPVARRRSRGLPQLTAEDQGRPYRVEIAVSGSALVQGDRDLLAQMLANLIENALCHAPPPSPIAISLVCHAGTAEIVVADEGPGVPEAEREKVFRRLYRLERSRTTDGSGLGLSLVAAIAALHGGQVRLEDNSPGVRAVATLPLDGA